MNSKIKLILLLTYFIFTPSSSSAQTDEAYIDLMTEVLDWLVGKHNNLVIHKKDSLINSVRVNKQDRSSLIKLISLLERLEIEQYLKREPIQSAFNITMANLHQMVGATDPPEGEPALNHCTISRQYWEKVANTRVFDPIDRGILKTYTGKGSKSLGFSKVEEIPEWALKKSHDLIVGCKQEKDPGCPDYFTIKRFYFQQKDLTKDIFKAYAEFEKSDPASLDTTKYGDIHRRRIGGFNVSANKRPSHFIPLAFHLTMAMAEEPYAIFAPDNLMRSTANRAHQHWYEALINWNVCEAELINGFASWYYGQFIDKKWVEERYRRSIAYATKIRTCCLDPEAVNHDTLAENRLLELYLTGDLEAHAVLPLNDSTACCLYKGCNDEYADNYVENVGVIDTCFYTRCLDRCHERGYKYLNGLRYSYESKNGIIIESHEFCDTTKTLCGCTNECAENYNPNAIFDDGSCKGEVCGCLDSSAVDYQGDPLATAYYNPQITKHVPDSCHWTGIIDSCLNPSLYKDPRYRHWKAKISNNLIDTICGCKDVLAYNFQSKATHHVQEDCRYESFEMVKMLLDSLNQIDNRFAKSADQFNHELDSILKIKGIKDREAILKAVKFKDSPNGNNLILSMTIDKKVMDLKFKAEKGGIPLGVYRYSAIDNIIDIIFSIIQEKLIFNLNNKRLEDIPLRGFIIGEADGNPIRRGGILYENTGRSINEFYDHFHNDVLANSGEHCYLREGDRFYQNRTLAYLRAYIVWQRIGLNYIGDLKQIELRANTNSQKGGDFRKIEAEIVFVDAIRLAKEVGEKNKDKIRRLQRLKIRYEKQKGDPVPKVASCLCPT